LIVPGRSVGVIKLAANADSLIHVLGKPDAGDAAMRKAISTWYDHLDSSQPELSIYTSRDLAFDNPPAIVKQIWVTSPGYKTVEGVGAGSSLPVIQRFFNVESSKRAKIGNDSTTAYYDRKGIGFLVDHLQMCTGILIYPKGSVPPDSYLKFIQ
jgi:hypothetical protein